MAHHLQLPSWKRGIVPKQTLDAIDDVDLRDRFLIIVASPC
jgi:hypothetical protein